MNSDDGAPLRILHLTGDSEDAGGILSVLRNLQEATAGFGWEHTVWVSAEYRERRAPPLRYARSRYRVGEAEGPLRNLVRAARAAAEVRALLETGRFQLLHAHSRVGLALATALTPVLRQPVVFTNHAYARHRALYRWAARVPGLHTVLLTPAMGDYYRLRVDDARVSVVSCCCADALLEAPLAARRSLGPSEERPLRLVGLGHVVPWKGWHLVLEALLQLAPREQSLLEFSLYGPTPETAEAKGYHRHLESTARAHALERRFVLRGPTPAPQDVLRQADWLLHPTAREPCGVAILEALALGVPVLASSSGGPKDLLAGWGPEALFAPGSAAALASALKDILEGRRTAPAPERLRALAASRSASAIALGYRRVYERALASRAPPWPPP